MGMGPRQLFSRRLEFLAADPDKSLVLDLGTVGARHISIFTAKQGGAGNINVTVDVSIDGEVWRSLDAFAAQEAGLLRTYENAHRYIRVKTVTVSDGVFEIAGM